MKESLLFTPCKIGPLTLRNRTIRAAAFEGMCAGNSPTDLLYDYHRSVARGGIGMTTLAYASVTRNGLSFPHQLWLRPEIVPGLRRITDAIHAEGASARSFTGQQAGFFTDARYGAAHIKAVRPDRVKNALSLGDIAIVAGFQGINAKGDATTLGRGGSDTSAVALAVALGADICEIYTDVDGVFTADPRIVPTARRIPPHSVHRLRVHSGDGVLRLQGAGTALCGIRSAFQHAAARAFLVLPSPRHIGGARRH